MTFYENCRRLHKVEQITVSVETMAQIVDATTNASHQMKRNENYDAVFRFQRLDEFFKLGSKQVSSTSEL